MGCRIPELAIGAASTNALVGAGRSSADWYRIHQTCTLVSVGRSDHTSPAVPDTCGAAADVAEPAEEPTKKKDDAPPLEKPKATKEAKEG